MPANGLYNIINNAMKAFILTSVLLALPFFILLFVFFPRLPPLWHIPIPEQKSVTGMSDRMSPGDIAQLSQSTSLAFRIIGNMDKLPSRNELYWRAMVLDQYDGKTWTSSFINQQPILENKFPSGTFPTKYRLDLLPVPLNVNLPL